LGLDGYTLLFGMCQDPSELWVSLFASSMGEAALNPANQCLAWCTQLPGFVSSSIYFLEQQVQNQQGRAQQH